MLRRRISLFSMVSFSESALMRGNQGQSAMILVKRASVTVTLMGIDKSVTVADGFQYKTVLFGTKKTVTLTGVTVTEVLRSDLFYP